MSLDGQAHSLDDQPATNSEAAPPTPLLLAADQPPSPAQQIPPAAVAPTRERPPYHVWITSEVVVLAVLRYYVGATWAQMAILIRHVFPYFEPPIRQNQLMEKWRQLRRTRDPVVGFVRALGPQAAQVRMQVDAWLSIVHPETAGGQVDARFRGVTAQDRRNETANKWLEPRVNSTGSPRSLAASLSAGHPSIPSALNEASGVVRGLAVSVVGIGLAQ